MLSSGPARTLGLWLTSGGARPQLEAASCGSSPPPSARAPHDYVAEMGTDVLAMIMEQAPDDQ